MSIFTKAKGLVGVSEFFESEGIAVVRIGQGIRTEVCPHHDCNERPTVGADRWKVSIRNGFWKCFSCGDFGDVVKAAALRWRCKGQADAAALIIKRANLLKAGEVFQQTMVDLSSQQAALEIVVESLFGSVGCSDDVRESLHARGIPNSVIDEALEQGLIVGLNGHPGVASAMLERACGKEALIDSGMWRVGATYPAAAFRPLLFRFGHVGLEARRISDCADGPTSLRYGAAMSPFVLRGNQLNHCVTKSAIDALSLRALGTTATITGLPGDSSWCNSDASGLPNPGWFSHIQGSCEIAFSGTLEGASRAQQLALSLSGAGIEATVAAMPEGSDANDMLIHSLI